jgi:hypothetical protein
VITLSPALAVIAMILLSEKSIVIALYDVISFAQFSFVQGAFDFNGSSVGVDVASDIGIGTGCDVLPRTPDSFPVSTAFTRRVRRRIALKEFIPHLPTFVALQGIDRH